MKRILAIVSAAATAMSVVPTIAAATPPPPARAATDCNAKVYVIDNLVCSTPELLALDRQVAEAFAAAPDAANPEWPRMVEGQQGWYWRSRQCFKADAAKQAQCLAAAYDDRLRTLAVLATPPAPGVGAPYRCKGPPWAEGRDVFLNRLPRGAVTLSDPSGQVLAIGLQGAVPWDDWQPFMKPTKRGDTWNFVHQNLAAYLTCKPA